MDISSVVTEHALQTLSLSQMPICQLLLLLEAPSATSVGTKKHRAPSTAHFIGAQSLPSGYEAFHRQLCFKLVVAQPDPTCEN